MRFNELLEKSMPDLIRDLQGCIRIPSLYQADDSGYPYGKPVQECLEYTLKLAESLGFAVHNMDNQLGWAEYGEGEEMVAVLGHLDVVPEGDGWTVDPYGGEVVNGRIYGRGTIDDKGPTIASLYALKALKDSDVKLNRRIRVIFGLNEETGSADMKYYAAHGGEVPVMGFTPDGEYPVINGEKGLVNEGYTCRFTQSGPLFLKKLVGGTAHNIVPHFAWADFACDAPLADKIAAKTAEGITVKRTDDGFLVEAEGVSAHGGTPWDGINANGRLVQFLAQLPIEGGLGVAITFLAEKLGLEYDGKSLGIAMEDELSGILTNNFGVITATEDTMEVKLNYRYPVTKTFDMCQPIVEKAFNEAGFVLTSKTYKNRLYVPAESELIQRLMKVYVDATGDTEAKPKSIGGGTYAKMLPNVVAFGPIFPGDEVREHKPDEFMEISRLLDNANILAEAMYTLAT